MTSVEMSVEEGVLVAGAKEWSRADRGRRSAKERL
jgi:hypothetical protein